MGDTRRRGRCSRRGEIAHLKGPCQLRGSEARDVLALLAGWVRAPQGCRAPVARAARGQGTRSCHCTARSLPRRKALPGGRAHCSDPGQERGRSGGPGASWGGTGNGRRSASLWTRRVADPAGWRVPGRRRLRLRSATPAPTRPMLWPWRSLYRDPEGRGNAPCSWGFMSRG